VVESTSIVDETIEYITLQQLVESADMNGRFQINFQLKDQEAKSLFDSSFQYNMIYESSKDEVGLKKHNLLQPCSHQKSTMKITQICRIKFSINDNYVDEVECEVVPSNA
jgi:hypothetical protein